VSQHSNPQSGFVLPAVLAVLAMIGLVTVGAVLALRASTEAVVSARTLANLDRAAATAEARFAFIMATQPLASSGFRVNGYRLSIQQADGFEPTPFPFDDPRFIGTMLLADGRPYRIASSDTVATPIIVEVQDAAGLINVNSALNQSFARLLIANGASAGDARRLSAKLADFTDVDGDIRFEGAERAAYLRLGQPAPPNKFVYRLQDLYRIPGWPPAGVNTTALENSLTAAQPRDINVNTATAEAIAASFDVSLAQANLAIRARELKPFPSLQAFLSTVRANVDTSDEGIYTFPSQFFRLRIRSPDGGPVLERSMEIVPRNSLRPIWVNDRRQLPPRAALSQEQQGLVSAALPSPTDLSLTR